MKICLTGDLAEALRPRAEEILAVAGVEGEVLVLDANGNFDGDPSGIEVVYFSLSVTKYEAAMGPLMALFEAPNLRWLQGPGAGIDHPIWQKVLDRGARLTNASGIHSEPIAQYIFTYVLHWERNVARHLAQQNDRHWEIIRSGDLAEKTLGIIGYGGIGQAAGRIGKAFGMRVLGSRRTSIDDGVLDAFVPLEALHELLRESHYVVLCMPFNNETEGMIGEAEFEAMRDDAVLINVARGGVVDEPALTSALVDGAIRGATLDVVSEEPLPSASPLWALENCVLTPHDAGYSPLGDERLGALFLENLGHFAKGEPLRNEIVTTGFETR
jgi:phosphoglycerate dehydrogenase-like enzyme